MSEAGEGVQGIVLAGGIASRMGFAKALAPVEGSCFVVRVCENLARGGVRRIHLVVNSGLADLVRPLLLELPEVHLVTNNNPGLGQMHSLKLGLEAAQHAGACAAVVTLVDLPWVQASTVKALLEEGSRQANGIVRVRADGKNGHPYLVPEAYFSCFLQAAPEATARDILSGLAAETTFLDVEDRGILRDCDSLEGLRNDQN